MPTIYLLRHGQASFGTDDYDVLSDLGVHQARVAGAELERRDLRAPLVVSGTLRRQQDTAELAAGPTFAHGMTKKCLEQEWSMGIADAIEAEAQAQAICMQTRDYGRAYRAFVEKKKPEFKGD